MKKSRFIALLFSIVLMIFWIAIPASAAENHSTSTIPTTGEPSIDPNYGEGAIERPAIQLFAANQYLANGKNSISRTGSTVTVSGNTIAYTSVDVIGVRLTLQKWDTQKGVWINLSNLGEYKSRGSSTVSGSQKVTVGKGRYRTSSFHWIQKGGKIESASAVSTYIEVK